MTSTIRNGLWKACREILQTRADLALKAMQEAQEAANEEQRSTAGDKYDTARAMSQNNRDMNARQLQEILNEKQILDRIDPEIIPPSVQLGSLVYTTAGTYFLSVSVGPVIISGETFFIISVKAPVAQSLLNKKPGETFLLNGNRHRVLSLG